MAQAQSNVFTQGTPEYETWRTTNINADTPDRYPREIYTVENVEEVSTAVKRAADQNLSVGVRSGGHVYHCSPLLDDGILIDTKKLNRRVEYDPVTQEVNFGPAVQVKEISAAMYKVDRFFPHGHSPTVAAGGFLLAGGQGWFMRGWGATCQQWIVRLEIVTASGEVVIASRSENTDLFWAARGSGTGFFGVVTKFWGRTIPAENLFAMGYVFEVGSNFEQLMDWSFTAGKATPKYGVDINMITFYKEAFDPTLPDDSIPKGAKLLFGVFLTVYTGTIDQARVLVSAYDSIPANVKPSLIDHSPLAPETWEHCWLTSDAFFGAGHGECWQINSFCNDPSIPLPKVGTDSSLEENMVKTNGNVHS